MAKFTSTADLNIEWRNHRFIGTAGTTHRLTDAMVEEFADEVEVHIPGFAWVTQDEQTSVVTLPIAQTDVSGLTAALAAKYDKTGGTISGATTVTGALGVGGAVTLSSTVVATGAVTTGALRVNGAATVTSTAVITGAATVGGTLTAQNNLNVTNSLTATDMLASGIVAAGSSASVAGKLKFGGVMQAGGTAFPGSPTTDDKFYRTDYDLWFSYDGTRWVSSQLFPICSSQEVNSSTFFLQKAASTQRWQEANMGLPFGTDWWISYITASVNVAAGGSALSASHKWSLDFFKGTATVPTTSIGSIVFDSGSSAVNRNGLLTVGALLDVTNNPVISLDATRTGTPGDLQLFSPFVVYARIVAT